MNIALTPTIGHGHKGASAKAGATGDPLADFMAMFEQIGEDGKVATTSIEALTAKPKDAAAALLAKLSGATEEKADGETDQDPSPVLASLLDKLGVDEEKNDTDGTKASGDTKIDSAKSDISSLLSLIGALVAQETSKTPLPTATTGAAGAVVDAVVSKASAKIAKTAAAAIGLPSGVKGAVAGSEAIDKQVEAAFSRLTAIVGQNAGESAKDMSAANDGAAAPVAAAANEPVPAKLEKELSALLARLGPNEKAANTSPASPQVAAPVAQHSATPAVVVAAAVTVSAQPLQEKKKAGDAGAISAIDGTAATASLLAANTQPATDGAQLTQGTDAAAQPSTSDDFMRHHLDLAKDTQWLDTLARDIARMADHDAQLRFKLNPEHLGSLKVEVLNSAQGTSVKLTADTESARAILADAQPKLIAEARAQGLRITEAQVDLSGHGNSQRQSSAEPLVVVRTDNGGGSVAEVEQSKSASAAERYA